MNSGWDWRGEKWRGAREEERWDIDGREDLWRADGGGY